MIRALAAVVLALAVAVLGVPVAATADDGDLGVEITSIAPAYLQPGESLAVRGTLANGSGSPVSQVRLSLRLQRNGPSSRSAMDTWLDPAASFSTLQLAQQVKDTAIPPGGSATFSFTVAPQDVPLTQSSFSWGPRGLLVDAVATTGEGSIVGSDRTLLVWYPGAVASPNDLSVVVPLAPRAPELLGAALGRVALAEQSGQRVAALAQATANHPAVTWALDPALLEPPAADEPPGDGGATPAPTGAAPPTDGASPGGAATPTPDPTGDAAGPDPAAALTSELVRLAQGREVVGLPYADADAAAAAHADRLPLYDVAADAGSARFAAAGIDPVDGIAWPAATQPDEATARALAQRGANALVLPESALPLRRQLPYTPSGRGTVSPGGGAPDVAALLDEDALSAALAGHAPGAASPRDSDPADLAARQYVLALTAMISRERPSESQHLLGVVPRSFDGDARDLAARLDALAAAPWVDLTPLSVLRDRADPGLTATSLPQTVAEDGEAPADLLTAVATSRADLAAFSTIAADPETLVRADQHRLLQTLSAAWRTDPGGRSSFANAVRAAAADYGNRVGVLSSGTVNLISETGDLPVTVRNGLDQPIRAQLRLTPRGPSLRLPDVVDVEVPAGSEVAFPVQVNAVGSADVEVRAELTDAQGRPVGQAATLDVRVRADWENVGTVFAAGLVLVALVIGLVRSIRRARARKSAAEEAPAAAAGPGG